MNRFYFLSLALLTILFNSLLNSQNFDWQWQNPLPTGADHNDAVILDPGKYMLFGNGSAVSLSTDGGVNWSISYIDPDARDIYDVIFPDQNTGYVVGTGGLIMKTTDGGTSWVSQNSGVTITLWDVDFINVDTGYAVGASGNILKTTNGGNSWALSTYGTASIYKVHFVNDNLIFLGSASSTTGRLIRSTNAGSNWDDITANITGLDGTVRGIHFFDADTGWISNSTGKIYKTTDGGNTGGIIYDIGSTAATIYEIKFMDADNGYAMTTAGRVLKTTNGGTTWDLTQTAATENLFGLGILGVNSEGTTPVLIGGDVGTIVTSSDDGATWQVRNSTVTNELLQRCSFTSQSVGYAVGGSITTGNQYGDILKSTDGGLNWTNLAFDPGYRTYSVYFLNDNLGYIGSRGPSGLYKTTDGGQNWTPLNTGTGVSTSNIYDIKFYNENLGFTMYASGQVARTTDGGNTWTAVSAGWGSAAGYEIFVVDSNVIYLCGGGNRVSKSTNGGVSFTQITTLGTVTLYSMHFFNANNGYIVGSTGKLYKTINGSTFDEIQLPTTSTMYTIRFVDDNNGFIGGAGDVFYTTDGGDTWLNSNISIGNSQTVRDIRFGGNHLWAVGTDGLIIRGTTGSQTTFPLMVNIADGWNMVSVPGINPDGQGTTTWWPGLTGDVFLYNGGYTVVTTTTPTEGYWMKHVGANTYNTGDEWPASGIMKVPNNPIPKNLGWNTIGPYECPIAAGDITSTPPGCIGGFFYGYFGGYVVVDTLFPGFAYWVRMNCPADINLPSCGSILKSSATTFEYFKEEWGRIVIRDAEGKTYTLYAVTGEVDLNQYEMPPLPPQGMFDIRYNSGRIAEEINSSVQTIEMRGIVHPVTLRAENMDIRIQDESGKIINENVKDGEEIVISNATISKLMVSGELIPAEYALEQNYPNPFNPSTTIEFSLPEEVKNVKLSIYSILGEKVAELVNTSLVAGNYKFQWNAQNVATGMYIYELRTDKFVSVKKMVLLK